MPGKPQFFVCETRVVKTMCGFLSFSEFSTHPTPEHADEGLLGHIEEIVGRGRVRGFIPWLITQQPAVVHKDVLSQADILIAMKLTASQDRDAIGAWIEGQADRQEGKRILGDLPRLGAMGLLSPMRRERPFGRPAANQVRDTHKPTRGAVGVLQLRTSRHCVTLRGGW
jgi:hypothetical protein